MIQEAIASVAMSHPQPHPGCDVCAAASGDRDAWLRVYMMILDSALGEAEEEAGNG